MNQKIKTVLRVEEESQFVNKKVTTEEILEAYCGAWRKKKTAGN